LPFTGVALVGEKVTLIVHVVLAAIDVQLFVCANPAGAVTLDTVTAAVPVFVMVTACAALVVPITVVNVRLVGESVIVPPPPPPPVAVPVSDEVTVCCVLLPEVL
jgi:hypothetical protein